ncbi:carboxypeptidase-like regulatory domain-containing protein [Deferrisoma sp.]
MARRDVPVGWVVGLWVLCVVAVAGCGGTTDTLLKIPFLSVTVKALDEGDRPIAGARVEASDGQQTVTDAEGLAILKFGTLGVHTITVAAEGRAPTTLSVSMPMDRGKTLVARLGKPVEVGAGIVVGGGGGFFGGLMGAQLYPVLFQSMFAVYGYSMDLGAYAPGQWTEWEMRYGGDDEPLVLRKAFLTRLPNGQEWWQLKLTGETPEDNLVLEVLFSPDRGSLRRMRQKVGGGEPQEVPVAEGWYHEPVELTPESIEGAVKQRGVTVRVPAGTFRADLMEFAAMGAGDAVRLWRVDAVPGRVVQVQLVEEGGTVAWESRLRAHGTGATTELGSY